jgi:hypothetical protein
MMGWFEDCPAGTDQPRQMTFRDGMGTYLEASTRNILAINKQSLIQLQASIELHFCQNAYSELCALHYEASCRQFQA